MIVTCEQCHTRYRLDPARIKGEKAKVRCSKCGHVFTVDRPVPEEPMAAPTPAPSEEALFTEEDAAAFAKLRKKKKVLLSQRGAPWWRWAAIAMVVAAVLGGGAYYYLSPSKPPISSTSPAASQEDPSVKKIVLSSAEGYFKENQKAGVLFVIKGLAQNKNPYPVSFIRLKAVLHDTEARKVKEEVAFAGNLFTDKELSTLDMAEIRKRFANKYGFQNANYQIPPEGTVSYMIVFDKIPDNLAEFTVKVVGCQAEEGPPQ